MNQITIPLTADKMVGFDEYQQLWVTTFDNDDPTRLTLTSRCVANVLGETCVICGRGWEATAKSLLDQAYIATCAKRVHLTCKRGSDTLHEYGFWYNLMVSLSTQGFAIDELPNGYWGKDNAHSTPWYRLSFKHLPNVIFTVGPRKRVYSLTVEGVSYESNKAIIEALKAEEVTKEACPISPNVSNGYLIHAWGKDKVKEYLSTMVKLAAPYSSP